jgi:hypothetical protein
MSPSASAQYERSTKTITAKNRAVLQKVNEVFYESDLFKAARVILAISLALVGAGSLGFAKVNIDIWGKASQLNDRISQLNDKIDQEADKIKQKVDERVQEIDDQIIAVKKELSEKSEALNIFVTEQKSKIDSRLSNVLNEKSTDLNKFVTDQKQDIGSRLKMDLSEKVSAIETEFRETVFRLAKTHVGDLEEGFSKYINQQKSTLDQEIQSKEKKLGALAESITKQEERLRDLTNKLEGVVAVSIPALAVADKLSPSASAGFLTFIGDVLRFSAIWLVAIFAVSVSSFLFALWIFFRMRRLQRSLNQFKTRS